MKDAFGRGADIAGADRLVIINRVSIIQPLPLSYRDQILRIPGVKFVTHNNWFGGVYQDEKNFFPQFAIDVENQRKVVPELIVPDDQWANFVKDRQGAVAGAGWRSVSGGKLGTGFPSRIRFLAVATPGISIWTPFITASAHKMTKANSGFSGTILKNACRRRSRATSAGTY